MAAREVTASTQRRPTRTRTLVDQQLLYSKWDETVELFGAEASTCGTATTSNGGLAAVRIAGCGYHAKNTGRGMTYCRTLGSCTHEPDVCTWCKQRVRKDEATSPTTRVSPARQALEEIWASRPAPARIDQCFSINLPSLQEVLSRPLMVRIQNIDIVLPMSWNPFSSPLHQRASRDDQTSSPSDSVRGSVDLIAPHLDHVSLTTLDAR